MNEVSTNPKDRIGRTKPPLHLIPSGAMIQEAMVMKLGAEKYGPYNWRDESVSATVYVSAAMRHISAWLDGEDVDPESGASHLAHARACCGILLDAEAVDRLVDDRPPAGAAGKLLEQFTETKAPTTLAGAAKTPIKVGGFPSGVGERVEAERIVHRLDQLACRGDVLDLITRAICHPVDLMPEDGLYALNGKVCYIAGPMRNYPEFNFPAFDTAKDFLVKQGWTVISPADVDRVAGHKDTDDTDAMTPEYIYRDTMVLQALNPDMRDAIVLLPGWRGSTGAQAEYHLTKWLGLDIHGINMETGLLTSHDMSK